MAYSSCLTRSLKPNKLLLRRIDGAIHVRSHVDLTFYSLVGSGWSGGGGAPRLLSSRESIHPLLVYGEQSLEHRLRFVLNGKMEHLTTHLHRPRTTRSPLSFWGDGGIVPFEPFFHAFPDGLEKAAINRTFLILPSFQEECEILFP
ncbi:hypothetical protein CFC21_003462 [Triticum aestivum]|nr:hypothetical protein CFC21_003462 [Triticum aestivum]